MPTLTTTILETLSIEGQRYDSQRIKSVENKKLFKSCL